VCNYSKAQRELWLRYARSVPGLRAGARGLLPTESVPRDGVWDQRHLVVRSTAPVPGQVLGRIRLTGNANNSRSDCGIRCGQARCTRSRGSAPSRRLRLLPFHSPLDGPCPSIRCCNGPRFRARDEGGQPRRRRVYSVFLNGIASFGRHGDGSERLIRAGWPVGGASGFSVGFAVQSGQHF
jgi:hypothetical protein